MPKTARPSEPTRTRELSPERTACAHCGAFLRADYVNRRFG